MTPELIARYCKVRTLAERGATEGERAAASTIAARMEAEHPGLIAHWPPRNVGGVGAGTSEQRKQAWWQQIDPAFVREVVTAAAGAMGAVYDRFSAGVDDDGDDEPNVEDPEIRAFVEKHVEYDVREDQRSGIKIIVKLSGPMVKKVQASDDIEWLDAIGDMVGGDVTDVFAAVFMGEGDEDLDEG